MHIEQHGLYSKSGICDGLQRCINTFDKYNDDVIQFLMFESSKKIFE